MDIKGLHCSCIVTVTGGTKGDTGVTGRGFSGHLQHYNPLVVSWDIITNIGIQKYSPYLLAMVGVFTGNSANNNIHGYKGL